MRLTVASDAGGVYACGWNRHGQLGITGAAAIVVAEPQLLLALRTSAVAVACGAQHSAAVGGACAGAAPTAGVSANWPSRTADGRLYTWGWNRYGQLGRVGESGREIGDDDDVLGDRSNPGDNTRTAAAAAAAPQHGRRLHCGWRPARVPLMAGRVITVACGAWHTVALCRCAADDGDDDDNDDNEEEEDAGSTAGVAPAAAADAWRGRQMRRRRMPSSPECRTP